MARFEKPRPRPPKAEPAFRVLTEDARDKLAAAARYVGSPYHTDVPKFGLSAAPRTGFATIENANAQGLKNPSCVVCPRKWVHRLDDATRLLQKAIRDGTFVSVGETEKPELLWARDPDESSIVYEAKLADPPDGYKAYPLTSYQVEFNLPFKMP